jgi:hypothetical protein
MEMTATYLIARHIQMRRGEPVRSLCALCGIEREETVHISKVGTNFNNYDLLRYPSKRICVYCLSCLCNRLRFTNFIATEQSLIEFKREGIIPHLFDPPRPPFVFCITISYKKQNAIRARVNYSREQFFVRIEDEELLFEPVAVEGLKDDMETLLGTFTKTEILIGNYSQRRIQEFGLAKLLDTEERVKKWRGHPAFDLILYALIDQKQKGERDVKPQPAEDLFS